jgi:hypothetical protein
MRYWPVGEFADQFECLHMEIDHFLTDWSPPCPLKFQSKAAASSFAEERNQKKSNPVGEPPASLEIVHQRLDGLFSPFARGFVISWIIKRSAMYAMKAPTAAA